MRRISEKNHIYFHLNKLTNLNAVTPFLI
jgi:hypothetical protein